MAKEIDKFYSDAEEYWSKVPPTIDGMLGGFGYISQTDIQGSRVFLHQLFKRKNPPGRIYAADCGAGIGRISKHLLLNIFEKVDLIEQSAQFLEKAKEYLGPKLSSRVGTFMPIGLQDFVPEECKYDIIWTQWVLGHLTDAHFIKFFEDCQKGLKPNGMIIVKENTTSSGMIEKDEQDSSITRPIHELKLLFDIAGLECYRQMKQNSLPKELYNVYMFALRPKVIVPVVSVENGNVQLDPLNN
ncbi:hypothetical protein FQA39_LY06681 [Lamprigera yunnana]|nr:hypothetical protein FQA39_LY06681 [Lamprigera yunnana]